MREMGREDEFINMGGKLTAQEKENGQHEWKTWMSNQDVNVQKYELSLTWSVTVGAEAVALDPPDGLTSSWVRH